MLTSLRRLALAVAAFTAVLVAAPAAHALSSPTAGYYAGSDSSGASISFEYAGDSVVEFKRHGSYFIAQATLTSGQAAFKKTEGHHSVDAGWTTSTSVSGTISYLVQEGNNFVVHRRSFTAHRIHREDLIIPYVGNYSGTDSAGRTVRFSFGGVDVRNLSVGGTVLLHQGYAGGGALSTSQNGVNFTMNWVTDTHVRGTISRNGSVSHFTANAVAS